MIGNAPADHAELGERFSGNSRRRWLLVALVLILTGLALSAATGLLWRGVERHAERNAFQSNASNVTATLGTMLRRDTDFVATLRTIVTMQPRLSPTGFDRWYDMLQGGQRQVGGIGSAVVASVPSGQLSAFEARRDGDAAFRALMGKWLSPVARSHRSPYCLLAGGGAIVPITSITAALVQEDWCAPNSPVGTLESVMLRMGADSGQFVAVPVNVPWLHTVFVEAAYYRLGMPVITVAQRRAAIAGWLVSSFDLRAVIGLAIGRNHGLAVDLYHTNPGAPSALVGSSGKAARGAVLTQRTVMSIDGSWTAVVHGAPVTNGPSANTQGGLAFTSGAIVSLLLSLLVLTLARGREGALRMVAEKTRQLRHQALHDALTGLPNRVLALDRAEQMLAYARRTHLPIAAVYIDIDGFKRVNDTYGHAAGDHFLTVVAARLRSAMRESDTAARLSGDEFLVLLQGSSLDPGPQLVAERLLEVLREPYDMMEHTGRPLSVTASMGVACGQRETAEELIADADDALYTAKTAGKNRIALFAPATQTSAQKGMSVGGDVGLDDALVTGTATAP